MKLLHCILRKRDDWLQRFVGVESQWNKLVQSTNDLNAGVEFCSIFHHIKYEMMQIHLIAKIISIYAVSVFSRLIVGSMEA